MAFPQSIKASVNRLFRKNFIMPERREIQVSTSEELAQFCKEIREEKCEWFAVDTEADSLHSYENKLCLIQFASEKTLALIDPLTIPHGDLISLLDLLDEAKVLWMHGADYDMAMFRKTFGRIPAVVWDTQTAVRLLGGEKFGLANLIEQEFDIKLSKQSQKADWGKRPLSEKMVNYAYNDVRYILEMGHRYVERLKKKGRYEWFVEACDAARTTVEQRDERPSGEQWRINGWGKLQSKGLCFLKALWEWRDEECRKLDRPAFKLCGNQVLMDMSFKLEADEAVKPPHYLRPGAAKRMIKAINEAREIPQSEWPSRKGKRTGQRLQVSEATFNKLRAHRNKQASKLGIDSTLIASRSVLEKLAAGNISEEEKDSMMLNWQIEALGGDWRP